MNILNIKQNKKIIVLLLVFLVVLTGLNFFAVVADTVDRGEYDQFVENDSLIFYLNSDNAAFAVQDKKTEDVWYSNPPDWQNKEKVADGSYRGFIGSQLILQYYTTDDQSKLMNTYSDSIEYEQFEIEEIDHGFRVEYKLGKEWDMRDWIPLIVTEESFAEILAELDESDRQFLLDQYSLVTLDEKQSDDQRASVSDVDPDQLFAEYYFRILEGNTARSSVLLSYLDNLHRSRSDLEDRSDIRQDDVLQLRDKKAYVLNALVIEDRESVHSGAPQMSQWDQEDISKLMQQVNFDPFLIHQEHQKFNFGPPEKSQEIFKAAVEYKLEDDNLLVRIPDEDIISPRIEQENGLISELPVHNIRLLPYFGAADKDVTGELMIPDGSGGLIKMNKEISGSSYNRPVYGTDSSLAPQAKMSRYGEEIQLPVFGIDWKEKGLLGVIEKGDALARLEAEVSGQNSSFNVVSPSFDITPKTKMEQELEDYNINIFQSRPLKDDIEVRYYFLDQESSDYVGMAHTYQEYLKERDILKKISEPAQDIPLYLNILGGIDEQKPVLGIPRRVVKPLTSYKQLPVILDEFREQGIKNLQVNYQGWLEGGIKHFFPGEVKLEESLGSRDDFKELLSFVEQQSIGFYPEVNFINLYRKKSFDGFSVRQDTARFLNRKIAQGFEYDLATLLPRGEKYHIISPARMGELFTDFLTSSLEYDLQGISVKEMGQQLNSDFRDDPKRLVDRKEAKAIYQKQARKINNRLEEKMLVQGGYDYLLPYTGNVIDSPQSSSKYNIIDRDIPFYQIVLHGYVNYSLASMNLAPTSGEDVFLHSLETGAYPYFSLSYEDSSVIKETGFHDYYTLHYQDWLPEITARYEELNTVLKNVQDKKITDHKNLSDLVSQTTFAEGGTIIVNYSTEEYETEDIKVAPRDYLWLKDGVSHE